MARGKKSEINSQLRKEWLEKYESGMSIFKLSIEYDRDPRTLKSHVERAQREREEKEARVIVIRDALLRHQAKLISYAERLYGNVDSGEPMHSDLLEDRMYGALKSHLPRSPLWNKYINQLNNLYKNLCDLKAQLREKLQKDIQNDNKIPTEESIYLGLLEAFLFQIISWAKGHSGINLKDNFRVHTVESGKSEVEYGNFNLGIIADSDIDSTRKLIEDWEKRLKSWPEYSNTKDIFDRLKVLKIKTIEELATIIERGIVPGSCKYCPV